MSEYSLNDVQIMYGVEETVPCRHTGNSKSPGSRICWYL